MLPGASIFRTGIGQDSHRFLPDDSSKPCTLGGIIFEGVPGLNAESDGDVVLHALCNAISSLTGESILAREARDLCRKDGITDSSVYVQKALEFLGNQKIVHVAITIEGKRPIVEEKIHLMRESIAQTLLLDVKQVGISWTRGDGLTDFGCGEGVQALCIVTTMEKG